MAPSASARATTPSPARGSAPRAAASAHSTGAANANRTASRVATLTPAENASLPNTGMTPKATAEARTRRAPVRCCISASKPPAIVRITGTLRVATIQSPGLYLLAPALQRLAAAHPALRVEVSDAEPETTMPALALGTLDLVIADEYPFLPRPPDPRIDSEPLLEERFRVILPRTHPLAAEGGPVALAALREEAWAAGKEGSAYGELTIRACRALGGYEPQVRHRSNDLLMLLTLVAAGQGVTLLPDLVRTDREPRVVARDVAEAPLTRTVFSAIRRGSARRPALLALRAALRAAVNA